VGTGKDGPGRGRRPSRGKTLPPWPFLIFFAVSASPGGYKLIAEKTAAAAAAADAGAVFYNYGATGVS